MENYNNCTGFTDSTDDNSVPIVTSLYSDNLTKDDTMYEPFGSFFYRIGRTGNYYRNGVMFYLMYRSNPSYKQMFGFGYYKLDDSMEIGNSQCAMQTFTYSDTIYIDSVSVLLGGDYSNPYKLPYTAAYNSDGVKLDLRYKSNDTLIDNCILATKYDFGNMRWEREFYGKFDSVVKLNANTQYYIKLHSRYSSYKPNIVYLLSKKGYGNYTYNKEYGQLFFSEDNGSTWHEKSYCDMLFKLHSVDYHSYDMTIYDNTENCSGDIDSSYSSSTGWKLWINLTGNLTPLNLFEDIGFAYGTLEHKQNKTGYWVWANYTSKIDLFENILNATGTHEYAWQVSPPEWLVWANYTGNATNGTSNFTITINISGFFGNMSWVGYPLYQSNITTVVSTNTSFNGTVNVDDEEYFLSGILSLDAASMILLLFAIFFYMGYNSGKRSGGWFMVFAGFLLIALGILVYGNLGYAATLVTPFAVFIMILGVKKGLYGPELKEKETK